MQKVVCLHIPKTAGTSLKSSLATAYGKQLSADKSENRNMWSTFLNVPFSDFRYTGIEKRCRCLIGHFPIRKYSFLKSKGWKFITWLRDPASRIISYYDFLRNRNLQDSKIKLRPDVAKIIDHVDVVEFSSMLTGIYKEYLEDLSMLDFIGFTESYSNDVKRLKKVLGVKLKGHFTRNVTKGPRTKITGPMLKQIKENQWEDYKTYVDAKQINRF